MDTTLEQAVLAAIDGDEMELHLRTICQWDRLSGTEGEYQAVEHIRRTLVSYGLPVQVYEFRALLSNPILGRVVVNGEDMRAKTRAFSVSTPPEGVSGEVVYVPGGRDMFRDFETRRRLEAMDLSGKVVLSEGGGRQNMIAAQARGAVGYIHMWPSDEPYCHEGTVSPVWGTPTPETIRLIPQIPVVQVTRADGEALKAAAARGPLAVRLITQTHTHWGTLRLPVTEIKGQTDEFVLVAGHIDSWHYGVTDNGTGDVALLELARTFAPHAGQMQRGVRIAWWPGHSNGRYAGSTWYADRFWQDIHANCVTYINIDSPGSQGATVYDAVTAVAENWDFAREIIQELTGQTPVRERPLRAGDQSFWGCGVSSLFMLLSARPENQRAAVGGCGYGWWWHTEEDTMDKFDKAVQVLDTQIYATAVARLCTSPLLPFRFGPVVDELDQALGEIEAEAGGRLDTAEVRDTLEALRHVAEVFTARQRSGADAEKLNRAALTAIRVLTPVNFTASGLFEHDAAVPARPLPGLQAATALGTLPEDSDGHRLLQVKARRELNRLAHALRQAQGALWEAI